jgi:hypothetical protein
VGITPGPATPGSIVGWSVGASGGSVGGSSVGCSVGPMVAASVGRTAGGLLSLGAGEPEAPEANDPEACGECVALPPATMLPALDDGASLARDALLGLVEKNQAPATMAIEMSMAAASQSRAPVLAASLRRRSRVPRPWTTPVFRLDRSGS